MIYCFCKPIDSDTVPQGKPLTSMGIDHIKTERKEKHKIKEDLRKVFEKEKLARLLLGLYNSVNKMQKKTPSCLYFLLSLLVNKRSSDLGWLPGS